MKSLIITFALLTSAQVKAQNWIEIYDCDVSKKNQIGDVKIPFENGQSLSPRRATSQMGSSYLVSIESAVLTNSPGRYELDAKVQSLETGEIQHLNLTYEQKSGPIVVNGEDDLDCQKNLRASNKQKGFSIGATVNLDLLK